MADENRPKRESCWNYLPPERVREIKSMGGKASQAKQKHKRNFREAIKWAMDLPAQDLLDYKDTAINLIVKQYPDLTVAEAMAIKTSLRAVKEGDAKALAILRDSVGELPAQTVKLQQQEPVSITIHTVGEEPATPVPEPTDSTPESTDSKPEEEPAND